MYLLAILLSYKYNTVLQIGCQAAQHMCDCAVKLLVRVVATIGSNAMSSSTSQVLTWPHADFYTRSREHAKGARGGCRRVWWQLQF